MFRHSPYARLAPPNEDDYGRWDDDIVPFCGEATVQWDPQSYYSSKYRHASWCRRSCALQCNPTNLDPDFEPYIHDPCCTGGCGNQCVDRYERKAAMESAKASILVAANGGSSGGWGTWGSDGGSSGGWGSLAPSSDTGGGWGSLASSDNVDGSGRSGDQAQNVGG